MYYFFFLRKKLIRYIFGSNLDNKTIYPFKNVYIFHCFISYFYKVWEPYFVRTLMGLHCAPRR